MFDIFENFKPKPKLYIADVTVYFEFKPRKNSKDVERHQITLEKVPIVLDGDKFPTKKTKEHFMKRVFEVHGKGSFENSNMRIVKIENKAYSSDLAYDFDYDKH